MKVLENLQYTKNHEWVLIEGNTALVGITDYAQSELGDIVFVDVDTLGEILNIDDIFGSVEAVKTVSDLYMPINGKILEINEKLESSPELVNEDSYQNGWIIKVEVDEGCETQHLLSADQYKELIGL